MSPDAMPESPKPKVVQPRPETPAPRLIRPRLWAFALPASILFLLLAYALPLGPWVVRPLAATLLPILSVSLGAALILLALFALIWLTLYLSFLPEEEGTLREELPGRWWILMQRRTGIAHWDKVGIAASVMGIILSLLIGGVYYVPGFVACALGLVGARRVGTADPWALLRGSRRISVPPPVTDPIPEDSVETTYAWSYVRPGESIAIQNRVTLSLSPSHVQALAAVNPFATGGSSSGIVDDAARLVNEGVTFEVRELGRYLLEQADRHNLSVYEEIDNTLRFAQDVIEYKSDEDTKGKEYWRWPIETLYERVGDCDCKSVLAAALFRTIFLLSPNSDHRDVVLLISAEEQHMALAVEGPPGLPAGYLRLDERTYFFCESTAAGMRVGVVPEGLDVTKYTIIRLLPEAGEGSL